VATGSVFVGHFAVARIRTPDSTTDVLLSGLLLAVPGRRDADSCRTSPVSLVSLDEHGALRFTGPRVYRVEPVEQVCSIPFSAGDEEDCCVVEFSLLKGSVSTCRIDLFEDLPTRLKTRNSCITTTGRAA
jgi:hypothetical protein